ncbi:KR domain-containing protein [Sesbania bispinosa]|nr:KR domain-containing protein [Sesbania bispinosa]
MALNSAKMMSATPGYPARPATHLFVWSLIIQLNQVGPRLFMQLPSIERNKILRLRHLRHRTNGREDILHGCLTLNMIESHISIL